MTTDTHYEIDYSLMDLNTLENLWLSIMRSINAADRAHWELHHELNRMRPALMAKRKEAQEREGQGESC